MKIKIFTDRIQQKNNCIMYCRSSHDDAFTLLELIVSLVLISILMSVSIDFLWPFNKNISDAVNEIIDAKTEAKSLAIFNGEPLQLIFYPQKIVITNHEEKIYKEFQLPHDFDIIEVNKKMIINKSFILSVSKNGLAEECLIKIKNDNSYKVVYLPTIGKPLTFDDDMDFIRIHKEYL